MISNDPKFNLGQLNVYKLMFAIKLLMEKRINFFWSAGFSDLPVINATVFRDTPPCDLCIMTLVGKHSIKNALYVWKLEYY